MMDPPPFQHSCEYFQQPMIWLGSDWKPSKISHCMQTDHVIDCATAPIFPRAPTDTVRFDDCGSARSEQANAATSKGAVCLSFWKQSNRSICWTARCLPWPRLDSASHSAPFPGSATESRGSALSREARYLSLVRQVSSRSENFLRRASRAISSCQFVALYFRRVNLTFSMFTQITKVCTDDWKLATRSCRDCSRFVPPSLTS